MGHRSAFPNKDVHVFMSMRLVISLTNSVDTNETAYYSSGSSLFVKIPVCGVSSIQRVKDDSGHIYYCYKFNSPQRLN